MVLADGSFNTVNSEQKYDLFCNVLVVKFWCNYFTFQAIHLATNSMAENK
jgi:hypothetical protein